MKWTKRHSAAAVAAKARQRMERAANPPEEKPRRVPRPRTKARFYIQIRDYKIGDSLSLTLKELPWRGRFVDQSGQEISTVQLCTALRWILNHPGK